MLQLLYLANKLPGHLEILTANCQLKILTTHEELCAFENIKLLLYDQAGLGLGIFNGKKITNIFRLNFLDAEHNYRRQYGRLKSSGLAKAVIGKIKGPLDVLDATAGFGADSFDLASLGCQVTMYERNPIMYFLLLDALTRAKTSESAADLFEHMHVFNNDLVAHSNLLHTPDVLYLDPMFPARTKSALVKKEAIWLQTIVGKDPDAELLLNTALNTNVKRVVVKRPVKAGYLADLQPNHSITGKTVRFDVYVK